MKYAICNELYEDWPLEKACQHAVEVGYTGLEIAPYTLAKDIRSLSSAERNGIRRTVEEAGLDIVGLHWLLAKTSGFHLTSHCKATRNETAMYLGDLSRLCGDLGGGVMVFGSPQQRNLPEGITTEVGMERATEVIKQVVPSLERDQVTLAIEPLGPEEGNFILTAKEGRELVDRVGSDFVKLHLDVKAMSTEPTSIESIIKESSNDLFHFHANDPNRQGPGMGEVTFEPIYKALGEIGYSGWVSVEVFDYSPGIERLTRESIEYLLRIEEAIFGSANRDLKP